jgi:hypothetical protein
VGDSVEGEGFAELVYEVLCFGRAGGDVAEAWVSVAPGATVLTDADTRASAGDERGLPLKLP